MTAVSAHFWPWWIGGMLTAGIAVAYPAVTSVTLGVSGLFDRLVKAISEREPAEDPEPAALERALIAATIAQFGAPPDTLRSEEVGGATWLSTRAQDRQRIWFLPGLLLGAALWKSVHPGSIDISSLGLSFDARFGGATAVGAACLFGGGILVGFGARMTGGCTSGHGLSGFATGQPGSLLATPIFWTCALGVAWAWHMGVGP